MINRQYISIDNASEGSVIETFSPFTMVLSTSAYVPTGKIWKISYDFGDGNQTDRVLSLNPNSTDVNLPIPQEPGDPRNFLVENQYYIDTVKTNDFLVNVYFYIIGANTPEKLSFTIRLNLPDISDIFESYNTIKLVGSRMFGLDNQLIYLFESQVPNYLIPVRAKF